MSSSAACFSASLSIKDRSSVGLVGVGGVCVAAGDEGGRTTAGLVGAAYSAAVTVGALGSTAAG